MRSGNIAAAPGSAAATTQKNAANAAASSLRDAGLGSARPPSGLIRAIAQSDPIAASAAPRFSPATKPGVFGPHDDAAKSEAPAIVSRVAERAPGSRVSSPRVSSAVSLQPITHASGKRSATHALPSPPVAQSPATAAYATARAAIQSERVCQDIARQGSGRGADGPKGGAPPAVNPFNPAAYRP